MSVLKLFGKKYTMMAYKYQREYTVDLIHSWQSLLTEIYFKIGEDVGICVNNKEGIFYLKGNPFEIFSNIIYHEEIEISEEDVEKIQNYLDELSEKELEVETLKNNIKNITKSFLA